MSLTELINRYRFWREADRLGPDMFATHWRLYFKTTMRDICVEKFKIFGVGAEFRPYAYAQACSKIAIGRNVVIRPGSFLFADPRDGGGGICIEDDVLIGSGVHIYTNNHRFSDPCMPIINQGHPQPTLESSVVIRRGAWIGAGTIILQGVDIGENSVIGAGSVVTKSVPARSVAVGNPANVIKKLEKKVSS